jgi:hypothetical protein
MPVDVLRTGLTSLGGGSDAPGCTYAPSVVAGTAPVTDTVATTMSGARVCAVGTSIGGGTEGILVGVAAIGNAIRIRRGCVKIVEASSTMVSLVVVGGGNGRDADIEDVRMRDGWDVDVVAARLLLVTPSPSPA